MKKAAVAILLIMSSMSVRAGDAAEEARQAEIAFAQAFADRDTETFFSFLAPDAHFLSANRTLSGVAAVREVWGAFFKEPQAPFRWEPKRVVVNAAGNLALSMGPIHDHEGKHLGDYSSVWQKQPDGSWKVIFDGPGSRICPPDRTKE